jgi:predicted secreted protein
MAKIVGVWTFSFGGTTLAAGRGGSISRSTGEADLTTTDSNNNDESAPTRRTATVSYNGVIDYGTDTMEDLREAYRNSTVGTLSIVFKDGTEESYSAFITNLEESAEYEGEPTFSVTFKCTGAPTYTPAGS